VLCVLCAVCCVCYVLCLLCVMCCVCYVLCVLCVVCVMRCVCYVLCVVCVMCCVLCVLCVVCCVCYPKRLSRYDFLLIPWWKQSNLPAYVCGCIKSRALVSTGNTLEADFCLHVHVSFHEQVTNVGVPLVDEYCCKTTGK